MFWVFSRGQIIGILFKSKFEKDCVGHSFKAHIIESVHVGH
jgi:hypothetical protein